MATIDKRRGKYLARVRLKGVSRSKTFDKRSEAVAWAAKTETELREGRDAIVPDDLLFGDLLQRYLLEVTPTKRGYRSEAYRIRRALKDSIANTKAADLRPQHFATWRDERLKRVQAASVRRELETLSAVCDRAAKEWGMLSGNPVKQISRPGKSQPRHYIPSDEAVSKVTGQLGVSEGGKIDTVSQRIGIAVLFAIETAMRAGEICNMRWQDVNLKRRVVHLPITKNGSSRDVPLSRRAVELLGRLPKSNDSVFNLKVTSLDAMFRRARDKAGVAEFNFHDTRHKALTIMAGKVEPMQLAKISGHKDLRVLLNVYYNPDVSEFASLLD